MFMFILYINTFDLWNFYPSQIEKIVEVFCDFYAPSERIFLPSGNIDE